MKLGSGGLLVLLWQVAACHPSAGMTASGSDFESLCNVGPMVQKPALLIDFGTDATALAVDDAALYESYAGPPKSIVRAAKEGKSLVPLAADEADELVVDDSHLYYRGDAIKRVSKTTAETPVVLASSFDLTQDHGLVLSGGQLFFAAFAATHVVVRMDADGTNQMQLVTSADPLRVVGANAGDVFFTVDLLTGSTQQAVPRDGGTPRTLATGNPCFASAIDADYLYCAGVLSPFKVRLSGGPQIPLCQPQDGTSAGPMTLGAGNLYLMSSPVADLSGYARLLEVSTGGGGQRFDDLIYQPQHLVSDGTSLFWSDAVSVVQRLDL